VCSSDLSNFSELVRQGLRDEITRHEEKIPEMTENDRKLFALLTKMRAEGKLLDEKEARKHGIRV
jgi:hypothetical protein